MANLDDTSMDTDVKEMVKEKQYFGLYKYKSTEGE